MGNLVLAGSSSGSTTITPASTGTYTITLPAETGTIQTSGAGFTTNGVAYATSTSALTTGSALTFNGTTTTTPRLAFGGTTLPSAGTATIFSRSSDNNFYLQTGSGNNVLLLDSSQNTMYNVAPTFHDFLISGSSKMYLNSTGNLGIGTSTFNVYNNFVGAQLDQSAPTRLLINNQANNSSASAEFTMSAYGNSWTIGIGSSSKNSNALTWALDATAATPSVKMKLETSGDLILSATNPNFQGSSATGSATLINNSAGAYVRVYGSSHATKANFTEFANGSSTSYFDSGGNLLVGTSNPYLSTNSFFKGAGASQPVLYLFKNSSAASTDQAFCIANGTAGGTVSFQVLANGNAQNTNNSYGAISDIKLKENIVDATPKLADLMQVKIRNYNFKSDETKAKQIGVVAQELESVFPAMIEETSDADKDGNSLGTTTKSVKYSVFVPMLIKAIQELNAKVIALETKLGV
jgi:hypothetical protein